MKRKLDDDVEGAPPEKKPIQNPEGTEENAEVPKPKVLVNFSIKGFREELCGENAIKSLRDFSNSAEWGGSLNDVILEYLQEGGSIAEITSLLDVTAQQDLATALPVFRAVYLILSRILKDAPDYKAVAASDAESLLSTFVPTFQSMLAMKSVKHRKIVLKLLTTLVSLSPGFGRQILNWLSLTPPQLEELTEPGAIRKSFINFLLAFFYDENVNVFRSLLEKKGLLSSIIPNLKYDDFRTVVNVLNVMAEKILTHPKITKTTKLNVINTQVLQCLFQLYDWAGPKAVAKGWKKPKASSADPEALAAVAEALDKLLIVLCTNKKHGVAFNDKSLAISSPRNQLILTALEAIPKPWEKPHTARVVIEILKSLPDLIKPCLSRWESSFEPRDSESWTQAVTFYIQILSGLQAEQIVTDAMEVLTPTQLQSAISSILLSPGILKHVQVAYSEGQPASIRCQGLGLLSAVMTVLRKFFAALEKSSFKNIKRTLITSLAKALPDVAVITKLWKTTSEEFPGKNEIIGTYFREVVKLDPTLVGESKSLCKALIRGLDDEELAKTTVAADILQTVCILEPTFLSPSNKRFRAALELAFQLAHTKDIEPLGCILHNSETFLRKHEELDVFVSAWLSVKKSDSDHDSLKKALIEFVVDQPSQKDWLPHLIHKITEGTKEIPEKALNLMNHLAFFYGCLPDSNLSGLRPDISKDVQQVLRGIILKKKKPSNYLQNKILLWLLADDDESIPWDENNTLFDLLNVSILTMNYVRYWTLNNSFNEARRSKCLLIFEKLKAFTCPSLVPYTDQQKPLSVDVTPTTLYTKIVNLLMKDRDLMRKFSISTDDSFQVWLKEVLTVFGLTTRRALPEDLLSPWRLKLLSELEELAVSQAGVPSMEEILFWLKFLRPTIEEISSLSGKLLTIPASGPLRMVWLVLFEVLSSQEVPEQLIRKITQQICGFGPDFDDVLLKLFSSISLSVVFITPDFMTNAVRRVDPTKSFIEAVTLCATFMPYKELGEVICDGIESIDGQMAIALLNSLLQRSGVNISDSFMDESSGEMGAKAGKKKMLLEKQVVRALPELATRCWPRIKMLMRNEDGIIIEQWPKAVRLLLKELVTTKDSEEKLSKAFKKNIIPFAALPCLSGVLNTVPSKIISSWIRLLVSELALSSWKSHYEAFEQLIKADDLLKSFVGLRTTEEWRCFVYDTIGSLSVKSDPYRWAILRCMMNKTWSEGANNSELSDVFNSIFNHVEFSSVMLSGSPVKEEIAGVLLAICKFWPSVIVISHVPLFLAAYEASLSTCDQIILQILRRYEQQLGNLSKFEPLFWGQPAISHYSVRTGKGMSLWRQVNMKSVLELLDMEKIKSTITSFPIERELEGTHDHNSRGDLYDPSFILPLFSNLFSPGAVPYCMSFIHSGGLSFTVAALSSRNCDIRAAAAVVISRFYSHLQLTHHCKQKPVWLHILDCLRFGLDKLPTSPVLSVVTVFWARAILEVSDPLAPLFSLHHLLLAKPAANLHVVPEFLTLFFSVDVNMPLQRKWALEVIRDGLRSQADVSFIVLNGSTINTIMTFFYGSNTPIELKIIILQILGTIQRVRIASTGYWDWGIDLWIRSALKSLKGPLVKPYADLLETAFEYQKDSELQGLVTKKKTPTNLEMAMLMLQSSHRGLGRRGLRTATAV